MFVLLSPPLPPRLAEAKIQDFGKLLGIYIGPGAPPRQWTAVREELRARARFLASLGLAWSGVLPLYRSHVLPVAGHVAQMSPVPRVMVRNEDRCLAVILKAPYRSVPLSLLRSATAFGLSIDVPDIATLGLAATFRAATASHALERLTDEHRRARAARACNLSPFLNAWTRAGVVGHMSDTLSLLNTRFSDPPPGGRGVQRWATSKLRKEFKLEIADLAIARRTSAMVGLPITIEDTGRLRGRLLSMRNSLPPVVLSSMVRSICNAWTTTGRFSGQLRHAPLVVAPKVATNGLISQAVPPYEECGGRPAREQIVVLMHSPLSKPCFCPLTFPLMFVFRLLSGPMSLDTCLMTSGPAAPRLPSMTKLGRGWCMHASGNWPSNATGQKP